MSLHGAYDSNNIFAKILRGEAPCVKVMEDEGALAFMDLFPQSRGHTLIVPKAVEARNFLEFPLERVGPFMATVQRVAIAVENALKPDGLTITQFNGAPAGQTVFHLHFHVIPRWQGETLRGHAGATMADKDELMALAARIAAAL
jgi:histidine triad (HIT) family protein